MIDLEDKNRWQDLAVQIIQEFKAKPLRNLKKHGSLYAFAVHREAEKFYGKTQKSGTISR